MSGEPRVAVVHEWLHSRAGSEKTFEAMAQALPAADLYALSREPAERFDFGDRDVTTTFLDRSAFTRERRELTLPLMPLAWRTIRARGPYDVVLTSSHACVRAFPPARDALHFSYTHAPMRYAWDAGLDQRTGRTPPGIGVALAGLRRWDRRKAGNVDFFAANSTAVRERIRRYYGRDAVVLPPPVDVEYYTPDPAAERRSVLAMSRFIPYKKLDLAIRAAALAGLPVTVAGSGPDEARLREVARESGAQATFEIRPSDERLRHLYRSSVALVFPAHEDFGIVPVEAQACGTPVVALDLGGSRDTVVHGETGYRVAEQDPRAFAEALERLARSPLDPVACRANAETFSRERFQERLLDWMRSNGAPVQRAAAA